jgi:hypothetical protein
MDCGNSINSLDPTQSAYTVSNVMIFFLLSRKCRGFFALSQFLDTRGEIRYVLGPNERKGTQIPALILPVLPI